LSNALKFTYEGSVKINIAIKKEDGESYLCVTVADTGIGIKHTDLPKLFKQFGYLNSSEALN